MYARNIQYFDKMYDAEVNLINCIDENVYEQYFHQNGLRKKGLAGLMSNAISSEPYCNLP